MFLVRDGGISWIPAVDVYEKINQWLVQIELPGISSDGIDPIVYPESVLIKEPRLLRLWSSVKLRLKKEIK